MMYKRRPRIMKSKSSNSTLKFSPMDKKSTSNATLRTQLIKKRGVYVERKEEHTNESLNDNADNVTPIKRVRAPKRRSQDRTRFLASVLSLLSSNGTENPDTADKRTRFKRTTEMANKDDNKKVPAIEPEKRKKKYRSKILNSRNYPPDSFEILQSKKNIVHTPSVDFSDDSEAVDDIKWAEFLPRLVKPDEDEIQMEKNKKLSHLVNEVAEGRMNGKKEKQVTIETDEPKTLVSENRKHTTNDPGFYNFFVDLLETTFSVYNIKSENEFQDMIPSIVSSKVAFEMDEVVANKLNVAPDISRQPSVHSRIKMAPKQDLDYRIFVNPPPKKKKIFPRYRAPRQALLLSQSMSTRQPHLFPQTASMPQKSFKNNSKQMLLSMLREQLSVDNHPVDEPQNLFQALKVLARNKRKTEKTLRFQKTSDEQEFMFKSRILPPKRSRIKKDSHKNLTTQSSDFSKWRKKYTISEDESSGHSLEVVNINYDLYDRPRRRTERILTSNYSPASYSNIRFSPVESVLDSYYERYDPPGRQQVVMRVKAIKNCRSRDFCTARDEALT